MDPASLPLDLLSRVHPADAAALFNLAVDTFTIRYCQFMGIRWLLEWPPADPAVDPAA
jgi:hypothetical protein